MKIQKLTVNDIPEIVKLLAFRHKQERQCYEGLNQVFENEQVLEKIVRKNLGEKRVIAIGAFEEGQLIAFIISNVKKDHVFGRCAWVKYDGLALAEGVDAQVYRLLYAHISKLWITDGCLKHYIIVPGSNDDVLKAWLFSGFAYEQVFGIKKLVDPEIKPLDNITIRKAMPSDEKDLKSISGLIMSYQAGSPTYAAALPELFSEIEDGYGGLISDQEAHVLMAYQDDTFLGFTCGYFEGENIENMMVPYKNTELGVAGTFSHVQNKGIGTVLTLSLFRDAIEAGYENTTTDWRITNMKSSVFWPKMGYEPYAYRLVRNIDPRVYWANGKRD